MVAVVPNLLSDQPPAVPLRAGLGDRFHYFRGASGHRYLFSQVDAADLADFRSAIVVLARRASDGHLAATDMTVLDRFGRPLGRRGEWPPRVAPGVRVLVHLMAESESERFTIVDDLMAASTIALPLAA